MIPQALLALKTAQQFMKPQQQPLSGLQKGVQGAMQFAENLTSPVGKTRAGVFDFLGVPEDKRPQMGSMRAAEMQQPMPQIQTMNFASPAQTQGAMQMYQQMMQAIKQKRGF